LNSCVVNRQIFDGDAIDNLIKIRESIIYQRYGVKLKTVITILVFFLIAGCAEVEAVLNGEVPLDPGIVETEIENGIYDQTGIDVYAECPDPLSAAVGDSRTCTIEHEGFVELVDITVQNTDGYFIWQIRE